MHEEKGGEPGYSERFYSLLKTWKNKILSKIVSDDYIKGRRVYSDLETGIAELREEKAAEIASLTEQKNSELSKLRKEKETEIAALKDQNSRLMWNVVSLDAQYETQRGLSDELRSDVAEQENLVDYFNDELRGVQGKVSSMKRGYEEMLKSFGLQSPVKIPDLEKMFEKPNGTMLSLEWITELHKGKNALIMNQKSANTGLRTKLDKAYAELEDYKVRTMRQIEAMESKEKLITILENVEDTFFLVNNNMQVEYISTATKSILGCDDSRLSFYINKPFANWFKSGEKYDEVALKVREADAQGIDRIGPFSFKIPVYVKQEKGYRRDENNSKLVDIEFVRTKDRTGYFVLIDKAKFFARLRESVKESVNEFIGGKEKQAEGEAGLALQPST
jgi:hypothetical protein